jgi:hypothetical protein
MNLKALFDKLAVSEDAKECVSMDMECNVLLTVEECAYLADLVYHDHQMGGLRQGEKRT